MSNSEEEIVFPAEVSDKDFTKLMGNVGTNAEKTTALVEKLLKQPDSSILQLSERTIESLQPEHQEKRGNTI